MSFGITGFYAFCSGLSSVSWTTTSMSLLLSLLPLVVVEILGFSSKSLATGLGYSFATAFIG